MCCTLLEVLSDPCSSVVDATEAIRHLLQLQADGARFMRDVNPVAFYLDTRVRPCHAGSTVAHVMRCSTRMDAWFAAFCC
jgi:hypothetical protein